MGKIQSQQGIFSRQLGCCGLPMKTPGDHQMKDEPDQAVIVGRSFGGARRIILDSDGDTFSNAAQRMNFFAFNGVERRVDCAQDENAAETNPFERLPYDARL